MLLACSASGEAMKFTLYPVNPALPPGTCDTIFLDADRLRDRRNDAGTIDLRHGKAGGFLLNPMTMFQPRRKGDRDRPRE